LETGVGNWGGKSLREKVVLLAVALVASPDVVIPVDVFVSVGAVAGGTGPGCTGPNIGTIADVAPATGNEAGRFAAAVGMDEPCTPPMGPNMGTLADVALEMAADAGRFTISVVAETEADASAVPGS
jgi:hypothetical protein